MVNKESAVYFNRICREKVLVSVKAVYTQINVCNIAAPQQQCPAGRQSKLQAGWGVVIKLSNCASAARSPPAALVDTYMPRLRYIERMNFESGSLGLWNLRDPICFEATPAICFARNCSCGALCAVKKLKKHLKSTHWSTREGGIVRGLRAHAARGGCDCCACTCTQPRRINFCQDRRTQIDRRYGFCVVTPSDVCSGRHSTRRKGL